MSNAPETNSTNIVAQLLGDASGPHNPVTQRELEQLQISAYVVHRNFYDVTELGDDVPNTGLIQPPEEYDERRVRVEVFGRVHNYLSSLYSFNEHARDVIDRKYETRTITKRDFLPSSEDAQAKYVPEYVKRLVFLWGLRNQLTHDHYGCLKVTKETAHERTRYYRLEFEEIHFSPTPKGGLEDAGEYLRYCTRSDRKYPLCYIGAFHRTVFNEFESDLNEWCRQSLQIG